jgi:hypothetical protein
MTIEFRVSPWLQGSRENRSEIQKRHCPSQHCIGQQTETRLSERDMDQNSGEENKGMQTDIGYHQSM